MALIHVVSTQTRSINVKRKIPKTIEVGNKQSIKGESCGVVKSAWDLACLFGKRTTIHGISRVFGEAERRYERILWFFTVTLAFAASIYACLILSHRFNAGKFETVLDQVHKPVTTIFFPVVTICNLNRLNWARIEEAKRRFMPNVTSPDQLELFEQILGTYDELEFGKFQRFDVLKEQPLDSLNHINFSLVVDFMTWSCEEFLEDCKWSRAKINCCEFFSKRRSKSGICWSFNTIETEEGRRMQRLSPKWPLRNKGAGPKSGLKLRLLINPDKHYPKSKNEKGISVMITEPNAWDGDIFLVLENTKTYIQIDPIAFFNDENTKSVSSDIRKCVFEHERSSSDFKSLQNYIYMMENCQAECNQEYLMRYCNCSMDLMFPPGKFPPCKAKDLLCLARNNDKFQYTFEPNEKEVMGGFGNGMECQCLVNCYSVKYKMDGRSTYLPEEENANFSYVDLDVHFRFFTFKVYRTTLVFTWMDLMVAFGGIMGLFLGCSLISGMEVVYFICVEIPLFLLQRIRGNRIQHCDFQTTHQSVYQKFNDLIQINVVNNNERPLDEHDPKCDKLKTSLEGSTHRSFEPGHLVTWKR